MLKSILIVVVIIIIIIIIIIIVIIIIIILLLQYIHVQLTTTFTSSISREMHKETNYFMAQNKRLSHSIVSHNSVVAKTN